MAGKQSKTVAQPSSQPLATNPLPGVPPSAVGNCPACEYGAGRSYGGHAGVDIVASIGQKVVACVEGVVECAQQNWYSTHSGAGMVAIRADKAIGEFPAGTVYGNGHMYPGSLKVSEGDRVELGQLLGYVGDLSGTDHLHFYINVPGGGGLPACSNGNANPENWVRQVMAGEEVVSSSPSPSSAGGVTTGVDLQDVEAIAKAAAFATYLELPGVLDSAESLALKGERSLLNDQPLLPFIEQLCQASLRRFQSMPNGNFFAFYPDYFGGFDHRTPYWEINDIEIIDGKIELSDEALATHVYVVGDTVGMWDGVNVKDETATSGVVDLFRAMSVNFITGLPTSTSEDAPKDQKALVTKDQVIHFLKKYGARPYKEEAPMIRSSFYELFLAYQRFCLLWSKQFLTEFQFTYMPELFPGGIIALPDHGIQMFVEGVDHAFDYESGFTTTALLSSPAALPSGPKGVHEGMIRANAINPEGNG